MLECADISAVDVDMNLLAYELSRIPCISELLKQTFGENICCKYLPDHAIANGAARWAYHLMTNNDDILLGLGTGHVYFDSYQAQKKRFACV